MSRRSRSLFEQEHEDFRDAVRTFLEKEVVPHHDQWEADGIVDREVWTQGRRAGPARPRARRGVRRRRDRRLPLQRGHRRGDGPARRLRPRRSRCTTTSSCPTSSRARTDEQKQRWLPGCAAGELIAAIAMTEPGAGSDLQGIRTTAVDAGDHYVLNGQKTFISNGILADLVIVVCPHRPRTPATRASACSSSSAAWRASSAAATSTRSARTPRTPPSCSSPTSRCPRRTCSARRARASST